MTAVDHDPGDEDGQRTPRGPRMFARTSDCPTSPNYNLCATCGQHGRRHYGGSPTMVGRRCDPAPACTICGDDDSPKDYDGVRSRCSDSTACARRGLKQSYQPCECARCGAWCATGPCEACREQRR